MSLDSVLAIRLLKKGVPGVPVFQANNGAASSGTPWEHLTFSGVPGFDHLEHREGVWCSQSVPEKTNKINDVTPGTPGTPKNTKGIYKKQAPQDASSLLDTLEIACRNLPVIPGFVLSALTPEDKAAWHSGDLSADTLRDFAKALSWRWEMNQGKAPTHYTRAALCVCCGPIWHWIEGTLLSCPWCQNRESGDPIPRPPVACRECRHWSPDKINPPGGLGSCVVRTPADWPEGAWWPRGEIICADWRPR